MSSSEVLEGRINQVHDVLPHTTQKGKESTKQKIVMKIKHPTKDNATLMVQITCYGMEDMAKYRDKTIRIKGLTESFKKDGSYMANNYASEIDDRLDSDPTEEHLTDKDWKNIVDPNVTSIPPETITKIRDSSNSELSKYSITVTRSKDYQSIALSEEFTGSFKEIESFFT